MQGFDQSFGTQFSTYAVPKIAGEIRRFLRDDGSMKVSRGLKERALTIRMARGRLCASLGREPTLSELAEETGFTPEDIAALFGGEDALSLAVSAPAGGLTEADTAKILDVVKQTAGYTAGQVTIIEVE